MQSSTWRKGSFIASVGVSLLLVIGFFGLQFTSLLRGGMTSAPPAPPAHTPLRIQGTHFVNQQGQIVELIGASRWSLEFSCAGDRHFTSQDFAAMKTWGINTVRITLSAVFWLNLNNTCPTYQRTVQEAIHTAEASGLYVIATLQWTEPFPHSSHLVKGGALYAMPDANGLAFWQSFATTYGQDGYVSFELYSEPHGKNLTWSVWRDGGSVNDTEGTYQAVGMATISAAIDQIAPSRIQIISGTDYGYDLSGVTKGYAIAGANIAYGTHPYDYSNKQPKDWDRAFGVTAQHYAVLATEFGEFDNGFTYNRQVIQYFHQLRTGFIVWVWHADQRFPPVLLSDWQGDPSPYGQPIHDAMLADSR